MTFRERKWDSKEKQGFVKQYYPSTQISLLIISTSSRFIRSQFLRSFHDLALSGKFTCCSFHCCSILTNNYLSWQMVDRCQTACFLASDFGMFQLLSSNMGGVKTHNQMDNIGTPQSWGNETINPAQRKGIYKSQRVDSTRVLFYRYKTEWLLF